MVSFKVS
jgi:hypothetical protein